MSGRVIIVVLGKQGAGKGTQCRVLAETLGIPHVATGDILRAAVRDHTPLGLEVEGILAAGGLVSDEIVGRLVRQRFAEDDARGGAILDGYPRNDSQAALLEEILGDDGIKMVINLDVPSALVAQRLSSRRVCQECGANYRDTDIEAISGTCEKCGGDVVQRSDDQPDAIMRRLGTYEHDTAPLLAFYDERGLLVTVNGDQTTSEVTNDIVNAVRARHLA